MKNYDFDNNSILTSSSSLCDFFGLLIEKNKKILDRFRKENCCPELVNRQILERIDFILGEDSKEKNGTSPSLFLLLLKRIEIVFFIILVKFSEENSEYEKKGFNPSESLESLCSVKFFAKKILDEEIFVKSKSKKSIDKNLMHSMDNLQRIKFHKKLNPLLIGNNNTLTTSIYNINIFQSKDVKSLKFSEFNMGKKIGQKNFKLPNPSSPLKVNSSFLGKIKKKIEAYDDIYDVFLDIGEEHKNEFEYENFREILAHLKNLHMKNNKKIFEVFLSLIDEFNIKGEESKIRKVKSFLTSDDPKKESNFYFFLLKNILAEHFSKLNQELTEQSSTIKKLTIKVKRTEDDLEEAKEKINKDPDPFSLYQKIRNESQVELDIYMKLKENIKELKVEKDPYIMIENIKDALIKRIEILDNLILPKM